MLRVQRKSAHCLKLSRLQKVTNGKVVVDDIAPGNVGITSGYPWLDKILPDFMKKPKIVDMIYQSADDWKALGYSLKKGGKISLKYINNLMV